MAGESRAAPDRRTAALRFRHNPQQSSSYFNIKQPLASGFTTWFEFQVHNPAICCTPGDGVAFIVQNSTATDPTYGARGAGVTAVGAYNGGMGYAGINNNLAIEFDIQANAWDPNSNHVPFKAAARQPILRCICPAPTPSARTTT